MTEFRVYTPTPEEGGSIVTALELIARAEKAEQALGTTRRALAEHVEENLSLHRRCAELEATHPRDLQIAVAAAVTLFESATEDNSTHPITGVTQGTWDGIAEWLDNPLVQAAAKAGREA